MQFRFAYSTNREGLSPFAFLGDDMNINAAFSSKYLRAVDIGSKTPRVRIKSVGLEEVGQGADAKQLPVVKFENKESGLVLNKTNGAIISDAFGPETDDWTGREVELRVEKVGYKGDLVDGIRVSVPQQDERKPEVDLDQPQDDDVPF